MRVFIDANIYQKIFEGDPSIEYFEKLQKLLKKKEFDLIFPKITRIEVYRNIAGILKKEAVSPKWNLPSSTDYFKDKNIIRKLEGLKDSYKKEWDAEHKKLINSNLKKKREMSKKLFGSFADLTIEYPESQELFKLASERKIKVYPPGKNADPLGDQLVWEILLKHCTDGELIIVSDDGDWQDLINKKSVKINPFLYEEWHEKTAEGISLLKDLGELIKKFEKEYKIPEKEIEKEKQEPFYSGYPYFLVPQNAGAFASVGTPSVGTFTVAEPIAQGSIMSGSPAFLPKLGQCIDCGKPRDNVSYPWCAECRARRGIF